MRILFITTSFPPFYDMQTIRNLRFLDSILKKGHKVKILTFSSNQNYLNSQNYDIIRTSSPIFYKIQSYLTRFKILSFPLKVFNVVGNKLLKPDTFYGWDRLAINTAKKRISISEIDLLISSSGSFTAHIVASELSNKFSIKWIADYGDPWSLDKYGKTNNKYLEKERNILKKCNAITFTTLETIQFYKQVIEDNKTSVHYLPCGFDSNIKDDSQIINSELIKRITYTGVAYSSDRNLSHAIKAVAKMNNKVSLSIVGGYSKKYEKIESSSVKFTGRVSYEESIRLLNNSDILLHIGNFGFMQIPGKTYIYLNIAKPIIYIKQEPKQDPTYELLKNFNGIIFAENTEESIYNAIDEVLKKYEYYLSVSRDRVKSNELRKFDWEVISEKLNEIIDKI